MKKTIILIFLFVFDLQIVLAELKTSNFNQDWLKSVISIEIIKKEQINGRVIEKAIPIGTGFLVRSPNKHTILVTAKHVIVNADNGKVKDHLAYRLNIMNGDSVLIKEGFLNWQLGAAGEWFLSEEDDIACRFVVLPPNNDILSIPLEMFLESKYVQVGSPIIILGFPLGFRSEVYTKAIARKGMISYVDTNNIIIDANLYPGNSGGPVVYVPIIKTGKHLHTPLINEEKLVGIATRYIPYKDVAISQQTKRPRITFEENSGLGIAHSSDSILSLINREDVLSIDEKI